MYKSLIATIALISLTACATNYAGKDAATVAAAVTVQFSKFDKGATYIGPHMEDSGLFGSHHARLFRTVNPDKHATGLSVRFIYTGGGWAFYENVSFEGGETLKLFDVARKVAACSHGTCTYMETTHLQFPEGYVERAVDTGFDIRYNSKQGSTVVNLPPEYIKGFLAAIPNQHVQKSPAIVPGVPFDVSPWLTIDRP